MSSVNQINPLGCRSFPKSKNKIDVSTRMRKKSLKRKSLKIDFWFIWDPQSFSNLFKFTKHLF